MRYKNIVSIFTLAVLSLNVSCTPAAPATGLAQTEKIHACIQDTANLVNLPQAEVKTSDALVEKFLDTGSTQAIIRVDIDGYRADDPKRKTDQVNFFAKYTTQGVNGPIEIYRGKQISFDENAFYPYAPNETGHAYYAHRDEIETGRNFIPTEQERVIEEWVYNTATAMERRFKTCMGFETDGPEVTIPAFPELN